MSDTSLDLNKVTSLLIYRGYSELYKLYHNYFHILYNTHVLNSFIFVSFALLSTCVQGTFARGILFFFKN